MADVMLINPSSREILENAGDRPPLGLLYLGAILENKGHKVRVRDMDHLSHIQFVGEIENNPPDYAGVSVYTSPLYKEAVSIGKFLKGKCKTSAGGYHATAMPETLTPYFDSVIVGEGEIALPQIIENNLDGIINGEKMDINKIPKPGRHLINIFDYNFRQDGRPAATLITSRGCPNNCIFCGNMNRKVRYHPQEQVISEIRDLKKQGYNDFYFYDDAFTANRKRTMSLLDKIEKEDIRYRITTRANYLDTNLAKRLKESGCSWVSIGIESGSDKMLKNINKNMTTNDNYRAVKMLGENGIKTKGFFMFGLPDETHADAHKTLSFSKILKDYGLTSADFYIMTPFPGTPIWNTPEKFGIEILDRDYTQYLEAGKGPTRAFHKNKFMSDLDIEEWRDQAEIEWKS